MPLEYSGSARRIHDGVPVKNVQNGTAKAPDTGNTTVKNGTARAPGTTVKNGTARALQCRGGNVLPALKRTAILRKVALFGGVIYLRQLRGGGEPWNPGSMESKSYREGKVRVP